MTKEEFLKASEAFPDLEVKSKEPETKTSTDESVNFSGEEIEALTNGIAEMKAEIEALKKGLKTGGNPETVKKKANLMKLVKKG